MKIYHSETLSQALNYLLENGIIEPAERETARKKLQYIKKGVAIRAVPIKLEPYSYQRQWQTLETATDVKQYKEENQLALF